jgi:beta-lactamase class A
MDALEDRQGTYGLVVDATRTGEQVAVQADRVFRAASVYKIFVAYAVLREAEAGRLNLDQPLLLTEADNLEAEPAMGLELDQRVTIREALAAMLVDSSNLAAHGLLRLIGRAQFNHTMAALGMPSTRVPILDEVPPWPEDGPAPEAAVTTPGEMARFLRRIVQGELLREPAAAQLAAWLRQPEELDPTVVSLPAQAEVFTKLGELDDAANVAGWVMTRQGPVILSIFSEGTDPGSARELIGTLSAQIYTYFNN